MIRASRSMLWLCTAAALGLHGTGLWVSAPLERPEVAGGHGAASVMLGSSFADMVAGAVRPVSDATVTPSVRAEDTLRPTRPEVAEPSAPQPVTEAAKAPPHALAPAVQAALAAPPQPQQIIAQANAESGLQVSRRPEAHPAHVARPAAPAPPPRPAPEPARTADLRNTSGSNADQTATRGSMTGHETATAPREGHRTHSPSVAEGNAAASNYPGQVMRHLARVPRPRADTRGTALVTFSITDGGRLASVSLARSSGSTRLDRAALTVVERAAPFPAPPNGAERRFSVQIKGE